jgi:hypothetical protein
MGFETVVRPAVFPNIRPAPARALPIEDAPDKGLAVITGGSNSLVDLPHSESHSWSTSRSIEVRRIFDKVRIYYTRPDGTVDKSKYWEFEVLRRIELRENGNKVIGEEFAPAETGTNIEITARNQVRLNPNA